MSKIRKRFERIINNPESVRWDDLITLLVHYGCCIKDGTHKIITHPESCNHLSVPVHGNTVKKIYVRKIISFLEEIEDQGGE